MTPTNASLGDLDPEKLSKFDRHVRIRIGIALGAAVVVAVGITLFPIDQLSSSLMLAPGLGAAVGLAVIAIAPLGARPKGAVVRQADLTPRQASSFGPRWGFILPLIAASALALMLVLMAMTASHTRTRTAKR